MPPTATAVSVADGEAGAGAVGLETGCGTPPSHAAIARLAVINTVRMRFMVHRFHSAFSGRLQGPRERRLIAQALIARGARANKLDVRNTRAKAGPPQMG